MFCPFCGSDQIIVSNSRPTNKNTQIWRRRKCLKCHEIFTTREKVDISYLIIIKKDGLRTHFSRHKLYSSIYEAISRGKKIDRGASCEIADNITQKIEEIIISQKIKQIKTREIAKLTTQILAKNYPDAALRYLVYFDKNQNLSSYLRTIKHILKEKI